MALTGGHRHVTLRNIRHNHRHTNNIDADYGNIMMMLTLVDVFVFEGVAVMMAFVILVKYYSTIITELKSRRSRIKQPGITVLKCSEQLGTL